jgi:predicted NACHT family NTPase
MGMYILGARGSGKSRLSGRVIAWQDYRAEIPLVIIDPLGGTIDNFLDKLSGFLQYVHPAKHS